MAVRTSAQEKKYFFNLHLFMPTGVYGMEKMAEMMPAELEKIGIKLSITLTDWVTMFTYTRQKESFGKTYAEGGADMNGMGTAWHKFDPDGIRQYMYSEYGKWGVYPGYPGQSGRIYDPELDSLQDEGLKELNITRRKEIYQRASEIIYTKEYIAPYMIRDMVRIMRAELNGYSELRGMGYGGNPWEWTITGKRPEDDVTVVVAFRAPIQGYNPITIGGEGTGAIIADPIFDTLVESDDKFQPVPAIAESWEFSKDGKTATFKLRKDVYFHDGVQLTSKDVLFTWRMVMDPKAAAPLKRWTTMIDSLEAPDPFTFVARLKFPTQTVVTQPGRIIQILPAHKFEGVKPENFLTAPFDPPIGSGPYKFVKWVEGQYVEEVANDRHFNGKPFVDRLIWRIIPDPATAHAAVEKGEAMISLVDAPPQEIARFKDKAGFKVVQQPGTNVQWVQFNLDHPMLANVWVRRAISYVMPRERLSKDIGGGYFRAASQMYVPDVGGGVIGFNPKLPAKTYSLEKAVEAMEKAGYSKEYLTLVPPTPLSAFLLYGAAGMLVGAIVGGVATYTLRRKK